MTAPAAPRPAPTRDVVTILLVVLSVAIAALAVVALVQVQAAAASVDTNAHPLLEDQATRDRFVGHVTVLRRWAGAALVSAGAVLGAALLLRHARAEQASV